MSFLSEGKLWKVFQAQMYLPLPEVDHTNDRDGSFVPVIVKSFNVSDLRQPPFQPLLSWTIDQALDALDNEVRLYTGPLASLQGRVVPRLVGVWTDRQEYYMVLQQLGGAIRNSEDWSALSDQERSARLSSPLHGLTLLPGYVYMTYTTASIVREFAIEMFNFAIFNGCQTILLHFASSTLTVQPLLMIWKVPTCRLSDFCSLKSSIGPVPGR